MGRYAKTIEITESLSELKKLQKSTAMHLRPRIQMLILMLTGKAAGKQGLADALGVNHNSVQTWRSSYEAGGIKALMAYKRGGYKKGVINEATDKAIGLRLNNATEAPTSFKELQQWVDEHYIPGINYQTLHKYVKRRYGAKLKVARKSHVKKDTQAVEAFKKNQ